MKSLLCSDSFVYSAMLIIAIAGFSAAELEQSKNRRAGGTSGLFAFPRVGRSDPSMNNNNNNNLHETETYESMYTNSLEDYDEFAKNEMKRASLIAFPRVGRNDAEIRKWARMMALQQALDKRAGPSATSGLWFGPRLGKRSVTKSDYDANKNSQKEMV